MRGILQDVRFAARTFRRRPTVTLLAVLTLALGVGANTLVFGVTTFDLMSVLGAAITVTAVGAAAAAIPAWRASGVAPLAALKADG